VGLEVQISDADCLPTFVSGHVAVPMDTAPKLKNLSSRDWRRLESEKHFR